MFKIQIGLCKCIAINVGYQNHAFICYINALLFGLKNETIFTQCVLFLLPVSACIISFQLNAEF